MFALLVLAKCCFASQSTVDFKYDHRSFDCPTALARAVKNAIDSSLGEGRRPVLVLDLDETMVKIVDAASGAKQVTATNFYHKLVDTGSLRDAYGIIPLTARAISYPDIVAQTKVQLESCAPELFRVVQSIENLGGSALKQDPHGRYLCDGKLLVMGDGGLSKRAVFDEAFSSVAATGDLHFDLIFVDNEVGWFSAFCAGGYHASIRMGHFFIYEWMAGEGVASPFGCDDFSPFCTPSVSLLRSSSMPFLPGSLPKKAGFFSSLFDLMDQEDGERHKAGEGEKDYPVCDGDLWFDFSGSIAS